MSVLTARVSYKKKDGLLSISDNRTALSWTPTAPGSNPITIQLARATNLQMTPATSPRTSIKVFAKPLKEGEPEFYVFQFTSPNNARGEGEAFKDALNQAMHEARSAAGTPQPGLVPGTGAAAAAAPRSGSATPAAASGPSATGKRPGTAAAAAATAAPAKAKPLWEDDDRLLQDRELQQAVLKANDELFKVFMAASSTKSSSITSAQFSMHFWSARLPLLRSFAFDRAQQRGTYNALISLKPRTEDGTTKLNISREQIALLFKQHPLILRAYDECVPKLREEEFWSRFAQSRLFKKLRGERVSDSDPIDGMLDKYLRVEMAPYRAHANAHLPHIIDLSGNEENHSQRQGNRPAVDMRPTSLDKVPIIRTLNELSEKLMANVAPSDVDPSAPIGMTEEEFDRRALALKDLEDEREIQQYVLKIRDESTLFSAGNAGQPQKAPASETAGPSSSARDPTQTLKIVKNHLQQDFPADSAKLAVLIGTAEQDNDDDEAAGDDDTEMTGTEPPQPKRQKTGLAQSTSSSIRQASSKILTSIRARRTQEKDPASERAAGDTFGLAKSTWEDLTLTHATSMEFLRQFWQAFLSGNPDRAGELASLHDSLVRAGERIDAIARSAEEMRQSEIGRIKAHIKQTFEATGRRLRINAEEKAPPGESMVKRLLRPTRVALERAIREYRTALADAQAQANAAAQGSAAAGGAGAGAAGAAAAAAGATERTTPQPVIARTT
ncbi:RNA polymerase II transcription factor B subunit 1 [Ascosphaera acerosa]|nr:RNA polymerase II transcription factor B subunit 1 [Ascosphaera acerosa]